MINVTIQVNSEGVQSVSANYAPGKVSERQRGGSEAAEGKLLGSDSEYPSFVFVCGKNS
jgi:hypothetical protein